MKRMLSTVKAGDRRKGACRAHQEVFNGARRVSKQTVRGVLKRRRPKGTGSARWKHFVYGPERKVKRGAA